jgi:hypothetical protein
MTKILSAGATAGLLPFGRGQALDPTTVLPLASVPVGVVAGASAPRGGVPPKSVPASRGNGGQGPDAPHGPPGNTGLSGAGIGSGGVAATSFWCAVLLAGFVCLAQALRRHRFRLVLSQPAGVVFLLQRPG